MIDPEPDPMAAALARGRLGRYLLADYLQPEALTEYRTAAALVPAEPTAARASILAGEAHILMLEGEAAQATSPESSPSSTSRPAPKPPAPPTGSDSSTSRSDGSQPERETTRALDGLRAE
jgi:hypothetical protein